MDVINLGSIPLKTGYSGAAEWFINQPIAIFHHDLRLYTSRPITDECHPAPVT